MTDELINELRAEWGDEIKADGYVELTDLYHCHDCGEIFEGPLSGWDDELKRDTWACPHCHSIDVQECDVTLYHDTDDIDISHRGWRYWERIY